MLRIKDFNPKREFGENTISFVVDHVPERYLAEAVKVDGPQYQRDGFKLWLKFEKKENGFKIYRDPDAMHLVYTARNGEDVLWMNYQMTERELGIAVRMGRYVLNELEKPQGEQALSCQDISRQEERYSRPKGKMLKAVMVEHIDDMDDVQIISLTVGNVQERFICEAKSIDGDNYIDDGFGLWINHDKETDEYYVVTDGSDSQLYYVDNLGDKHWMQYLLAEQEEKEITDLCRSIIRSMEKRTGGFVKKEEVKGR